jgi:hypothetical protein
VTPEREVYSVYGGYVGSLGSGPRILRKRSDSFGKTSSQIPLPPSSITPPAHVPAAPYDAELPMGVIDVLDEAPDLMPSSDFGEQHMDLD